MSVMLNEEKVKFSSVAIKELWRNTVRISRLIWRDKKRLILVLFFTYIVVAAGPFLQSGAIGLLVNELIKSAAQGVTSVLPWAAAFLILGTAVPAAFIVVQVYFDRKFWFYLQEKFELLILKKKGEIDVATYEDPAQNNLFQRVEDQGVWRVHTTNRR